MEAAITSANYPRRKKANGNSHFGALITNLISLKRKIIWYGVTVAGRDLARYHKLNKIKKGAYGV